MAAIELAFYLLLNSWIPENFCFIYVAFSIVMYDSAT